MKNIILLTLTASILTSCATPVCMAMIRDPECLTFMIPAKRSSFYYKMTVNVSTPEGLKSGSAIRKVKVVDRRHQRAMGIGSGVGYPTTGEAVVVDLGHRGKLFALLKGTNNEHSYPGQIAFNAYDDNSKKIGQFKTNHKNEISAPLDVWLLPVFVSFKDEQKPESIVRVYPLTKDIPAKKEMNQTYFLENNNFAEVFGEGVSLHSVTVELTDDSVTDTIAKHLPWIQIPPKVIGEFSVGDFKRE